MYYVVKHGDEISIGELGFDTYGAAKRFAEQRHKKTGHHYHVVEVKTVWTTTTLADLLNERGERALAEFNKANPIP